MVGEAGATPLVKTGPVSFSQEFLCWIDALAPGTALSDLETQYVPLRLTGPVDQHALERALQQVVVRHEPLRTVRVSVGSSVEQRVTPPGPFKLMTSELSSDGTAAGRGIAARAFAENHRKTPVSIDEAPLVRAHLARLGPEDHLLSLVFHCWSFDSTSVPLLIAEIVSSYETCVVGGLIGSALEARPLVRQYLDVAASDRDKERAGGLADDVEFWRKKLSGLLPIRMPTDRPRPPIGGGRAGIVQGPIPDDTVTRVRALASGRRLSRFGVFLAAFQALLVTETGEPDVFTPAWVSDRLSAETQEMIGNFSNMLVLRSRLEPGFSLSDVLDATRECVDDALAHGGVPITKVIEAVPDVLELLNDPENVWVVFEVHPDSPSKGWSVGDLEFTLFSADLKDGSVEVSEQGSWSDLELVIRTSGEAIVATWSYNVDLFDRSHVERLAALYEKLLACLTESPDMQLAAFVD